MKYAFTVTASKGYMFAINSTINACKHFGTNADFYIAYHPDITKEVRDSYKDTFPFKVEFLPMVDFGNDFFASKYALVDLIKDKYDAICVLDGDQFICSNVNGYFKLAEEGKFINETWRIKSDYPISIKYSIPFGRPNDLVSFFNSHLADLAVFFSPKHYPNFATDWYKQTMEGGGERNHPFVVMNRLICRDVLPDNLIALFSDLWLFDSIYWQEKLNRETDKLIDTKGRCLKAIHNRWWQVGRAKSELINSMKCNNIPQSLIGEHNMNLIKEYMEYFNDMTPQTKNNDYLKGKITIDRGGKE
jgi:hypothetical protein